MIAALGRVPTWVWLAGLVLLSFGLRLLLSRHFPSPWIFNDEVTYIERARSFAHDGTLAVRGEAIGGLSRVYPVLIAPAYALFDNQAEVQAVHPEAKKFNLQSAVAISPVPFHPGAIKYYTEKGVYKP